MRLRGAWSALPPPLNRPPPINRRNILRGWLVAIQFLLLVDGLLGAMALYAPSNAVVGVTVFGVAFLFMLGEIALVAWVASRRQLEEERRAREQD